MSDLSYAPDLGGDFDSDIHRRVMMAAPNPGDGAMTVAEVHERTLKDDFLDLDLEEIEEVLKDLEASGHVSKTKGSEYRNSKSGFDLLIGPPAHERQLIAQRQAKK